MANLSAIAGLTLFSTAYMAENGRGALQAVPRGQIEAGQVLGLNTAFVVVFIVLSQALIFALLELTGIARSVVAQPQFVGRYAEVYLSRHHFRSTGRGRPIPAVRA